MDSFSHALLLFLAHLLILLSFSTTHADAGNLTRLSVPFLCRPDQAQVLLQLKKSFFFDTSTTRLQSWQNGTDCCLWEGVGCDTSSGNVTVLDLNNCGLISYGLDPAIFNLTSLRRVDLSMNDFSRGKSEFNVPATGFEMFALLTHLNLSNSGLRGQVPIGISKLINLISLDLSTSFDSLYNLYNRDENIYHYENYLYESNFDTLVANLSSIRELYLDGVDLSSSILATSLPNLQVFSLADCRLQGPIHKSLARLHSLSVINLQGNYALATSSFPELFMDFLNLTVLRLSDTSIGGWFPSRPFQSKILRVLDLSSNHDLSGHVPNFSNASSLEILRLEETNLSSAKPISSSNFKLLKELSLDGNLASVDFLYSLGGLGSLWKLVLRFGSVSKLGPIFTWIGNHKNLASLTLYGCDFSMTTPSSVIISFKTLRTLTMDSCNLPGSIMSAIGNLKDLQTLEMDFCTTYGPIPSSFGNLKNLMNLRIAGFGISELIPTAIGNLSNLKTMEIYCGGYIPGGYTSGTAPDTIGQLNKLRFLILEGCYFSGRIPESIANLTQLTKLDLSNNAFNGEIPSSIFTIPALRVLDLSFNQLSGPIREFNQALSQLESVDLSDNGFSGTIPKAFFQLTSLRQLDLRSNNFMGLVDLASLWRLKNIDILLLSNNKLSVMDSEGNSPLPSDWSGPLELGLASCNITQFPRSLMRSNKYISHLDLSCNKISGEVPNWLWEICNSLVYLNLSHNMLTSMQLTSHVLPPLAYLDLSFNRFQGRIPMPASLAVILDYSNNRFSSILPNWASYLSETRYLSMSNNTITGNIPFLICNCSLEILVLSHNNFSGPIPSCLIENGQLAVLNLRENQLEGMLPSNIRTECFLHTIDLHGNKIYGQLPRGLSNCQSLEVLDFGSNRIVDIFPSWLSGLPKLSVIVLRSNQFYGTMNDIDGDTKSEVCFPSLQIMDVASNNFSGNLRPQWFERLKLMMSKMNRSRETLFEGNATAHTEFYRDSTEISYKGSDKTFESILTALTAIDFSSNRLEGAIPESIGRLVSLRVLNLSHNVFLGKIPAQLGGMTELESLDLSCNQLSGEIPQDLTNLTFLDVLNLSNNHLVGKIPESHQLSTFDSSSFEGNAGLCGPQLSDLPCDASPYNPGVTNKHKSSHHVDVVLFLFVGLGFGIGFASAIVVKWGQFGRWISAISRASRT